MQKGELSLTLALEAGGTLKDARIVYHTSGCREGKVIWICHALTANSDPEDWWPEMVGPGKPLDTQKNFIVCVNTLGSAYGSEGPARINPATGRHWLLDFPLVTVRDLVVTLQAVRKELGISHIDLLVGSSIGGFQALEWAVTEPDLFGRCVFIATAPRISPFAAATVETQLMALEADPTFREARSLEGGAAGLKCARAQALISYRCFRGYGLRQTEEDPDTLFSGKAGSYQRYQGEKLVRRQFDAYSYYILCHIFKSHNVGRHRGGTAAALSRIKADTTVVAIDTDGLFPTEESREWARLIPGASYLEISSDFGHDGFLLETARLSALLM
ncbi:MAG: homoserine O-acetyltransferase [Bacteroidales bacterium]|nr:homoserine O-acetyltransferase [Bacteroidales bacterium]MBR1571060.1 homoserine O-acetyltransferase [Bacteroidales bacterium]